MRGSVFGAAAPPTCRDRTSTSADCDVGGDPGPPGHLLPGSASRRRSTSAMGAPTRRPVACRYQLSEETESDGVVNTTGNQSSGQAKHHIAPPRAATPSRSRGADKGGGGPAAGRRTTACWPRTVRLPEGRPGPVQHVTVTDNASGTRPSPANSSTRTGRLNLHDDRRAHPSASDSDPYAIRQSGCDSAARRDPEPGAGLRQEHQIQGRDPERLPERPALYKGERAVTWRTPCTAIAPGISRPATFGRRFPRRRLLAVETGDKPADSSSAGRALRPQRRATCDKGLPNNGRTLAADTQDGSRTRPLTDKRFVTLFIADETMFRGHRAATLSRSKTSPASISPAVMLAPKRRQSVPVVPPRTTHIRRPELNQGQGTSGVTS